jgi:hypothetical protein
VRCRITGVDRVEHLRASHCKPWRDSSDSERLDGENGLLLTPAIDRVLDADLAVDCKLEVAICDLKMGRPTLHALRIHRARSCDAL